MTTQKTCPHCGAEMAYDDPHYTRFKCGSVVWRDGTTGRRDYACYITELAAKDAEIAQQNSVIATMLDALLLIRNRGGTTDDDTGLVNNAAWCVETARCTLEAVK